MNQQQQQGWAGNCGFKVRGGEKIKVTASAIKKLMNTSKKLCVEKGGKNYLAVFFRKLSKGLKKEEFHQK